PRATTRNYRRVPTRFRDTPNAYLAVVEARKQPPRSSIDQLVADVAIGTNEREIRRARHLSAEPAAICTPSRVPEESRQPHGKEIAHLSTGQGGTLVRALGSHLQHPAMDSTGSRTSGGSSEETRS